LFEFVGRVKEREAEREKEREREQENERERERNWKRAGEKKKEVWGGYD